ncbi:WHG domain-containing protein [Paenibacillus sp. J5C_2022]|uniref:TetR/AcrR family transcriptional regulator n=1 Tax=Paenibacillus sp. J5C2022 TaxID=2977129 RepID=UPI0021D2AD6C|nr:TetR/AcrR family transcriptional regulator [Paenibacillus sp. J5C2022]MCU6709236.1 WHG domain-containing protein [Paenibacillus sp. J5C2022]
MSPRAGLDLDKIIAAAAEMADADGVEGVTLAALAARLGVRSPSLYNHVNGLPQLREQLVLHGLRKLNDAVKGVLREGEGDEAIYRLGDVYIDFARRHPGLYELTLKAPAGENSEHARLGEELVQRLLRSLEHFRLGGEDALHALRGLRSLLHGFASIERQGGFGLKLEVNESLRYALGKYLAGLRQNGEGGRP